MKETSEGLRWLAAANDDLRQARYLAEGGFHAAACFHSQQAGEKAVKAVHFHRGARAAVGHSIRKLIELLEPRVSALDALIGAARELDLMYIPSRYPNGLDEGTPGEAFGPEQSKRAINLAQSILAAVTAGMQ